MNRGQLLDQIDDAKKLLKKYIDAEHRLTVLQCDLVLGVKYKGIMCADCTEKQLGDEYSYIMKDLLSMGLWDKKEEQIEEGVE